MKFKKNPKRLRLHETDSEDEVCSVEKTGKNVKQKNRKIGQKFKQAYAEKWPFLSKSNRGEEYVFCKLCKKDFSCSHSGAYDCEKHIETNSHRAIADIQNNSKSITHLFGAQTKQENDLTSQVMRAELAVVEMVAELNLPIATTGALVSTMESIFPDSKIAQGMQCGRSKATALVDHLAKGAKASLKDRMKKGPFTVSTDGSNDHDFKQFPVVVRSTGEDGLVSSELLSVLVCTGPSTGKNIFDLLQAEVGPGDAIWKSCIALGCDNANVMTGRKNGVYGLLKEKHEEVFLAGCVLHTVHNGAKKGAQHLRDFDEVLVDIWHYFNKSVNRQSRFKGDQVLCGLEQKKNLKHVCTRWLSITRCLVRMLENWDALKTFFLDEKTSEKSSYAKTKAKSIFDFVRSPTNQLFAYFMKFIHEDLYNYVLEKFQGEQPLVYCLGASLQKMVRRILTFFVKPCHLSGKDLYDISFKDRLNQLEDCDLLIGDEAREFLKKKEENHLRDSRVKDFFVAVRKYFEAVVTYFLEKLPLRDPVLKHAAVTNVNN